MFVLRGTRSNRFGIGATVRIETAAGVQVRQLVLARGVVSSSEPIVHFGLGDATRIGRVTIEWPGGAKQVFENLGVDRKFTITEPNTNAPVPSASPRARPWFEEVGPARQIALVAREAPVDELSQQPLLPMQHNRCGPAVAAGDLDGDGRVDWVLGGTTLDPARAIVAGRVVTLDGAAAAVNDGPVLIFDANGDGANDVLLTRGGASLAAGVSDYQPLLYLNDGHGALRIAPAGTLPPLPISAGAAIAADFDHDERLDLFIGGRLLPGLWPATPKSALLLNRNGHFEDVTDMSAPELREVGLVTAAKWADVDGDGWMDLIIATEWGPVKCFHNERGKAFVDWTERLGFAAAGAGWWSALDAADFNGDGRPDFVAGNVGLNTPYQADARHPVLLFAGDFNDDGGEELVEGYYEGDKIYPRRTRKALGAVLPAILKRFPTNDFYARATLDDVIGAKALAAARRYAATELRSGVFLSQPGGTYRFEPLPRFAQIAPIGGIVTGDFDGDGVVDIYAVQNSWAPISFIGHFDGGLSVLLRGDGHGHFTVVPPAESGLIVPGDAKSVALVDLDGGGHLGVVVTRNNSTTLVFRNLRVSTKR